MLWLNRSFSTVQLHCVFTWHGGRFFPLFQCDIEKLSDLSIVASSIHGRTGFGSFILTETRWHLHSRPRWCNQAVLASYQVCRIGQGQKPRNYQNIRDGISSMTSFMSHHSAISNFKRSCVDGFNVFQLSQYMHVKNTTQHLVSKEHPNAREIGIQGKRHCYSHKQTHTHV